jgi:hypothetical protein
MTNTIHTIIAASLHSKIKEIVIIYVNFQKKMLIIMMLFPLVLIDLCN